MLLKLGYDQTKNKWMLPRDLGDGDSANLGRDQLGLVEECGQSGEGNERN